MTYCVPTTPKVRNAIAALAPPKTPIRKGIPLPPSTPGRERSYPFTHMEVGDSFILERWPEGHPPGDSYVVDCRRLVSQASRYGFDNKKRFACRFVEDGLMGCWRTR
jgi:hypothetical protein